MFSFLNTIPQVTKNLLIINVLMFVITLISAGNQVDLKYMLSSAYIGSPRFEPYQIISHFFMHASFTHLFFNMFGLVLFGGILERHWGMKRFFIFYIVSALGAFLLFNAIGAWQLYEAKTALSRQIDLSVINEIIKESASMLEARNNVNMYLQTIGGVPDISLLSTYFNYSINTMLGASGAVFGIMAAFAMLHPNTELMLLFFPFPIKAKYLIGGYVLIETVLTFTNVSNDNIAHLAHVGGALTGAIIVLIWRRNRSNFY